jgi:kumamolisin
MPLPSHHRRLEGSFKAVARGAKRLGSLEPTETLVVSLLVRRRVGAPRLPGLRDYARSPLGMPRLSPDSYSRQHGADPQDLEKITQYASGKGLDVLKVSVARRTVVLRGTVAQMSALFAVEIAWYESPLQRYRGTDGHLYVPNELSDIVEGVFGLDNRQMARRFGGGGSPAPITPAEVAQLYNFPQANDASRQTIAVLDFSATYRLDIGALGTSIQKYFSMNGIRPPTFAAIPVSAIAPGSSVNPELELDVEIIGSIAPGCNIAAYFATNDDSGWMNAVSMAVAGEGLPPGWAPPSAISISWGMIETEFTDMARASLSNSFQEAAARGIIVFAATGDTGSDCVDQGTPLSDGSAHVNYPASDPWVTACGGTVISNISASSFDEGTWVYTGGGISDKIPLPPWQTQAAVPPSVNDGQVRRGIPDIAGHADGYPTLFITAADPGGSGTSNVAPLYAGLVAQMNSIIGDSVGYLNAAIYTYGNTEIFRDIADNLSNAFPPAPGYTSGPGWDACTGWGSVDGSALLNIIQTGMFATFLPTLL